ncbi:hypothetical protein GGI43DRAFT_137146 [Trichoderma evansii]
MFAIRLSVRKATFGEPPSFRVWQCLNQVGATYIRTKSSWLWPWPWRVGILFILQKLLQDPALEDNSSKSAFKGIRRIHGNLGYPGVVMLIPPPVPRILQASPMRRRFLQAASFDGQPGNSFTQTSLHLKLTDYKFPLASGRGAVDADIVMREALISVYDGSRWMADLDIIRALQSQDLSRFFGCSCVRHGDGDVSFSLTSLEISSR